MKSAELDGISALTTLKTKARFCYGIGLMYVSDNSQCNIFFKEW